MGLLEIESLHMFSASRALFWFVLYFARLARWERRAEEEEEHETPLPKINITALRFGYLATNLDFRCHAVLHRDDVHLFLNYGGTFGIENGKGQHDMVRYLRDHVDRTIPQKYLDNETKRISFSLFTYSS
ncbi:hypothetical protein NW763_010176 [Fusarium oxysporum]|nr:hypothetical protein NW763_010176 [Fusarium oxysporum]